jgi:P-type Ca2+ transporter type 2C
MSGFSRIFDNPTFIVIAAIVAIGQIAIVTFGGTVFKVEALGVLDWLGIIAFTSTVLIFAEIARRLRNAA